jgi:hypothetical protein
LRAHPRYEASLLQARAALHRLVLYQPDAIVRCDACAACRAYPKRRGAHAD